MCGSKTSAIIHRAAFPSTNAPPATGRSIAPKSCHCSTRVPAKRMQNRRSYQACLLLKAGVWTKVINYTKGKGDPLLVSYLLVCPHLLIWNCLIHGFFLLAPPAQPIYVHHTWGLNRVGQMWRRTYNCFCFRYTQFWCSMWFLSSARIYFTFSSIFLWGSLIIQCIC